MVVVVRLIDSRSTFPDWHSVPELQRRGRQSQKRLQQQTPQGQGTFARLGMVSDTGVQSVKPSARPVHQAQE